MRDRGTWVRDVIQDAMGRGTSKGRVWGPFHSLSILDHASCILIMLDD